MSTRAIVAKRGATRSEDTVAAEIAELEKHGFRIEFTFSYGILVSGTEQQYTLLESLGYRVKVYSETNILHVGSFRIDIEQDLPTLPPELRIPQELRDSWSHQLVQLAGPREHEWIQAIKARQIDVVEPISGYGLFVVGSPEQVQGLKELSYVKWVGPFEPAYRIHANLNGRQGAIQYVSIGVYPPTEAAVVRAALAALNAAVRTELSPLNYDRKYTHFIVEANAGDIPAIAALRGVRWLEFASREPGLDGERETQIVAENLNVAVAPNTAPLPGYQAWLTALGLSGANVTVAICDSGVDAGPNNNAIGHLDLRGRQSAFIDYSGGAKMTDENGHGTIVAGIAVGNAATGKMEPGIPFLWGQGMAPQASYVTQNVVHGPWPPTEFGDFTRDSVVHGAQVQNNSWWDGGPSGSGYTANARRFDQLVRDPNSSSASLQPLIIVFSAGNEGPNPSTISPPHEAKNPIAVGNTMTHRPGVSFGDGSTSDDIRGINFQSSRGPALDGRILPNIVAPGTDVSSARSEFCARFPIPGTGTEDPTNPSNKLDQYVYSTGTSASAPFVAGACAVLVQWWRIRTGGSELSPAMAKALLVNGAVDLFNGPSGRVDGWGNSIPLAHIPNNDQGWGRVSLENILLQSPDSNRGPKIFFDQSHAFTANGQQFVVRVSPVATTRPMRITLVWNDAAGAENAIPALVNDLDLEVTELATGAVYKGNVFSNGFSSPGGDFDKIDNIECVYILNPSGIYEVTIIGANIGDNPHPDIATPWQDFALVIDNAEISSLTPTSIVPVIDRSGSMASAGFVDATRTAARQFVDLMGVDDRLALVSFGDNHAMEYPLGAAPSLQTITGQAIRDAAKTAVENIAFGGCTNMGAGINAAKGLLNPVTGPRAMVLFSDGYDNKGCDPDNPGMPSALDAVAGLPSGLPVYTCAMGPTSDFALMEQIAMASNGRYFYMPHIDDLFEIYNYIRGQISGDAIVVNESALASASRVAVFIDSAAIRATISVAWADTQVSFTSGKPTRAQLVSIRLRNPGGQLIHENSSHVRRTVGKGYVLFEILEPAPGQWYVEVATAGATHLKYTVGGFVRSPIRLQLAVRNKPNLTGAPIEFAVQVFDGTAPVKGWRPTGSVCSPEVSIASLERKYESRLQHIQPIKLAYGDTLPKHIAKLLALREEMLSAEQGDPFAHANRAITFDGTSVTERERTQFNKLYQATTDCNGWEDRQEITTRRNENRFPRDGEATQEMVGALIGTCRHTTERGCYNIVVTASGFTPESGTRFVREGLVSLVVT